MKSTIFRVQVVVLTSTIGIGFLVTTSSSAAAEFKVSLTPTGVTASFAPVAIPEGTTSKIDCVLNFRPNPNGWKKVTGSVVGGSNCVWGADGLNLAALYTDETFEPQAFAQVNQWSCVNDRCSGVSSDRSNVVSLMRAPGPITRMDVNWKTNTVSWTERPGIPWLVAPVTSYAYIQDDVLGNHAQLGKFDWRKRTAHIDSGGDGRNFLVNVSLDIKNKAGSARYKSILCPSAPCTLGWTPFNEEGGLAFVKLTKSQAVLRVSGLGMGHSDSWFRGQATRPTYEWVACNLTPFLALESLRGRKSCWDGKPLRRGSFKLNANGLRILSVPLQRQGHALPTGFNLYVRPVLLGARGPSHYARIPSPAIYDRDLVVDSGFSPAAVYVAGKPARIGHPHTDGPGSVYEHLPTLTYEIDTFREGRLVKRTKGTVQYGVCDEDSCEVQQFSAGVENPRRGTWRSKVTVCGPVNCVTKSSAARKYPLPVAKPAKAVVQWPAQNGVGTLSVPVMVLDQYGAAFVKAQTAFLEFRFGRSDSWQTVDKVNLRGGTGALIAVRNPDGFYRIRVGKLTSSHAYTN